MISSVGGSRIRREAESVTWDTDEGEDERDVQLEEPARLGKGMGTHNRHVYNIKDASTALCSSGSGGKASLSATHNGEAASRGLFLGKDE